MAAISKMSKYHTRLLHGVINDVTVSPQSRALYSFINKKYNIFRDNWIKNRDVNINLGEHMYCGIVNILYYHFFHYSDYMISSSLFWAGNNQLIHMDEGGMCIWHIHGHNFKQI